MTTIRSIYKQMGFKREPVLVFLRRIHDRRIILQSGSAFACGRQSNLCSVVCPFPLFLALVDHNPPDHQLYRQTDRQTGGRYIATFSYIAACRAKKTLKHVFLKDIIRLKH